MKNQQKTSLMTTKIMFTSKHNSSNKLLNKNTNFFVNNINIIFYQIETTN